MTLYFWIGVVLCAFAIIVLTYIVMCCRQYIHNNHITNLILNRFIMLISSDTVSTLVTGILLLLLGSEKYTENKERAMTCTTNQLLLRLSTFLVPVLTGLTSIPTWIFQSYKCTDCYLKEDNQKSRHEYSGKQCGKKSMTMIALQWIIPILTLLSMSMTEPEIIKFPREEFVDRNEMESLSMLTISMNEIICESQENVQLTPNSEISRSYKQISKKDETHITISTVVDEIYNIVKNHFENESNQQTHQIHPTESEQENFNLSPLNNNLAYNNTITQKVNNNIQLDNDTINILNSIANTIQNSENPNKFLTKQTDKSHLDNNPTIHNDMNNLNILKLMENFTRQSSKEDHPTVPIATINHTHNMTDILLNDINIVTNHTMCSMTCQPSQILLKYIIFLILFINFFVPLIVTSVLRTLTKMNLKMLRLQEDDGINLKQKVYNLSGRNTMIGLLTLTPTLLETTMKVLLSIKTPEIISSSLLLTAIVGLVTRNLIGLHLINVIQNDGSTVHPLQRQPSVDSNTNGMINNTEIIVQEIESTSQDAISRK